MTNKLTINPNLKEQITETLKNAGLSPADIVNIFEADYHSFSTAADINSQISLIFPNDEYSDIIDGLADGYTLEQMPQALGINITKINNFQNILTQNHLSVPIIKAFNQYTIGSNMILGAKRGVPKPQILANIQTEFNSRMTQYGFSEDQITQISNYINGLNYSQPLYQNYRQTKEFLQSFNLPSKYIATIQNSVRNLNSYYHLDETLTNLDKGLTTKLPKSIRLFRAIKSSYLKENNEDLTSLIGHSIPENGYSSTSPLYDTSFAKYADYDVVFDIYAPKGTEGIPVTPFSSYGTAEQEFLLNSNDLYILDINPNFVDQFGRTKILCKALILSRDKTCYKNLNQTANLAEMSKDQLLAFKQQLSTNNLAYLNYRQQINEILESLPNEEQFYSSFAVYQNSEQQERCVHKLTVTLTNGETQTLLTQDFAYTDLFKKELLEPAIVDFARRTPVSSTNLAPTSNQTPEQNTKSNIALLSENNHILSINNIDTALAVQIEKQALQINPDIFLQQIQDKSDTSLTMGGFINILVLSSFIFVFCILVFFITLYFLN